MHAGTSSTSDILAPVETLILNNGYTDSGIPYIARALESNNTLKSLTVGTYWQYNRHGTGTTVGSTTRTTFTGEDTIDMDSVTS